MQLQTEVPKEGKLIERSLLSGDRLPLPGREKLWALGAKLQKACSPPRAAASCAASQCSLQLRFAHRMSLSKAEKFHSKNFCYSLIWCTISRNPVISKQKESDQSSYMLIKRRIKKPPYHFSKKKKKLKPVIFHNWALILSYFTSLKHHLDTVIKDWFYFIPFFSSSFK